MSIERSLRPILNGQRRVREYKGYLVTPDEWEARLANPDIDKRNAAQKRIDQSTDPKVNFEDQRAGNYFLHVAPEVVRYTRWLYENRNRK